MSRPALPPNRPRRSYPDAPTVDEVDATRRVVVLHIRLTPDEISELREDAEGAGITLSDHVRRLLFE